MSRVFICETPTRCDKHHRDLHGYPCWPCHQEWQAANPRTVAAIRAGRDGKAYRDAVAADREARSVAARGETT